MTLQDVPAAAWAALAAVVGSAGTFVARRKPDRADAASQLTTASVALINELQEQNQLLRDEVVALKGENHKLRVEVRDLKVQVDRLQASIDKLGGTA